MTQDDVASEPVIPKEPTISEASAASDASPASDTHTASDTHAAGTRPISPHRLFSLADGIFAISMTLLALDVGIDASVPDNAAGFNHAAGDFYGKLGIFFLAFMIASRFWVANHTMMARLHTVDVGLLERTVLFLAGISALPVVTPLLFRFSSAPQAVAFASVLLAVTSLQSGRLWWYLSDPQRRLGDVDDPDTRFGELMRIVFNTVVFLLAAPLTYLLPHLGAGSGWAPLIWLLLIFDNRFGRLVTQRRQ